MLMIDILKKTILNNVKVICLYICNEIKANDEAGEPIDGPMKKGFGYYLYSPGGMYDFKICLLAFHHSAF